MEKPPVHYVSAEDPKSTSRLARWLNALPRADWRIVDYSPDESRLVICRSSGERQLCIMCLSTWYVKSQVHIPGPSFVMEVGKKKMARGMLSGGCYDDAIRLAMDDGSNVHEIICDCIAVREGSS